MCIYINVIRRWWTRTREARPPLLFRLLQRVPVCAHTKKRPPLLWGCEPKIHCDEKYILKPPPPHLFLSLDVKEERKSYRSCRLHHFSAGGVYLICTIQTLCVFYISPATAGSKFMSQGLIEVSLSLSCRPLESTFYFSILVMDQKSEKMYL